MLCVRYSGLGYVVGASVANLFGEWQYALRVSPNVLYNVSKYASKPLSKHLLSVYMHSTEQTYNMKVRLLHELFKYCN